MTAKLSVGVYESDSKYTDDAARTQASAVLLFQEAVGQGGRLPAGMGAIGRRYMSADEQSVQIGRPDRRQAGYDWAAYCCATWPDIDVWQGLNEVPDIGQPDYWYRLEGQVDFEIGFADACLDNGRGMVCLNLAPGNYPTPDTSDSQYPKWWLFVATIRPILDHAAVRYHGVHIYSSGDGVRLSNPPDIDWYALRYRKLYDGLASAGVRHVPMLITELGHSGGWKRLGKDEAWRDFQWFGEQIQLDPRVKAAFIFGCGDSGGWSDYDVFSWGADIGGWNAAHPGVEPAPAEGGDMTIEQKVNQLLAQNGLITEALIALREGRLTGAEGVDGYIAALRGGQVPAGYRPVGPLYPPR